LRLVNKAHESIFITKSVTQICNFYFDGKYHVDDVRGKFSVLRIKSEASKLCRQKIVEQKLLQRTAPDKKPFSVLINDIPVSTLCNNKWSTLIRRLIYTNELNWLDI